jgi:hypothetical protein
MERRGAEQGFAHEGLGLVANSSPIHSRFIASLQYVARRAKGIEFLNVEWIAKITNVPSMAHQFTPFGNLAKPADAVTSKIANIQQVQR